MSAKQQLPTGDQPCPSLRKELSSAALKRAPCKCSSRSVRAARRLQSRWINNSIPHCRRLAAPPANITLTAGEKFLNLSWLTEKRQRNVGFYIHYLRKSGIASPASPASIQMLKTRQRDAEALRLSSPGDGSKWKRSEKVNSTQAFYQLQGLTPGATYRLRFTHGNDTFWTTDMKTEGAGRM